VTLASLELDVVNKVTHHVIAVIGSGGGSSISNGFLVTVSKSGSKLTSIFTGYEFNLSGDSSAENVNMAALRTSVSIDGRCRWSVSSPDP
jgi:hypothetical protein